MPQKSYSIYIYKEKNKKGPRVSPEIWISISEMLFIIKIKTLIYIIYHHIIHMYIIYHIYTISYIYHIIYILHIYNIWEVICQNNNHSCIWKDGLGRRQRSTLTIYFYNLKKKSYNESMYWYKKTLLSEKYSSQNYMIPFYKDIHIYIGNLNSRRQIQEPTVITSRWMFSNISLLAYLHV